MNFSAHPRIKFAFKKQYFTHTHTHTQIQPFKASGIAG